MNDVETVLSRGATMSRFLNFEASRRGWFQFEAGQFDQFSAGSYRWLQRGLLVYANVRPDTWALGAKLTLDSFQLHLGPFSMWLEW